MPAKKQFQFVSIGEILIDFISKEPSKPLAASASFGKFFGGAPANVAVNMKRLGIESTIVSKVGNDGLGTFLIDFLNTLGLDTSYIQRDKTLPTSMVVVTSQKTPPEFIAYREADTQIRPHHIPDDLIAQCEVVHTTAHAIARTPTRTSVLEAFKRAYAAGKETSFDPNYSDSFWPDREEALDVIAQFLRHTRFCKPSIDDCERIFGTKSIDDYLDLFHEWGVDHVMLTLGDKGALLSTRAGTRTSYPAERIKELVDPTGAGDAFIAGFFATYLTTGDLDRAMKVGNKTAAFSMGYLGAIAPLPSIETFFS